MAPVTTRAALLQALACGGPNYGGELLRMIEETTRISIPPGSVYRNLAWLTRDGLAVVQGRLSGSGIRGTDRILYALTAAGEEQAAADRQVLVDLLLFKKEEFP